MNINNYLDQIQKENILFEVDLKSILKIPKEKIEKTINDIKLNLNNPNKLKTLIKTIPKVEFIEIENYSKKKFKGFNSAYSLSKKVLSNSLSSTENENGIKEISAIISILAINSKDPKNKLKELLKLTVLKVKSIPIKDLSKFILMFLALVITGYTTVQYSLALYPFIIVFILIVHLIYKYV